MQDLGANTIRVYHVDPNGDHSGCMKAFEDVGIYLFVDLDDFDTQIEQVRLLLQRNLYPAAYGLYRQPLPGMKPP